MFYVYLLSSGKAEYIYILMRSDSLEASAGDFILKLNVMSADAADLSCFLLPLIQSDPSE